MRSVAACTVGAGDVPSRKSASEAVTSIVPFWPGCTRPRARIDLTLDTVDVVLAATTAFGARFAGPAPAVGTVGVVIAEPEPAAATAAVLLA